MGTRIDPARFADYCILRVERAFGERESWVVKVAPTADVGFASWIAVRDSGVVLEARGTGEDGPLATWDAMCRIEEALRERRAKPA